MTLNVNELIIALQKLQLEGRGMTKTEITEAILCYDGKEGMVCVLL